MKPGIYETARDDYHADAVAEQPSLSASIAHALCTQSALHAWVQHPRLNPDFSRREEGHFDAGNASHALLLEGKDAVVMVAADSWRTKVAQEQRDAIREMGLIPLLEKHAVAVSAMVAAAEVQLHAMNLAPAPFVNGKPEQMLVWEEGGVTCRALVDWLHDDLSAIDDYKTTSGSANPEAWTRNTLYAIGADMQVAFYLRGIKALTGEAPEWRFVVQENYPPYALSVVSLGPSVLELANAKVEYALATWKRCMGAGEWPGYAPRIHHAEAPGWETERWLNHEALMEEVA